MTRNATAHWSGGLKDGRGTVSSQSGILNNTPYTFRSRFGEDPETNPEELIAAAHAGCFSMALSAALDKAGFTAESIDTTADLNFDPAGPAITAVHLTLTAKVPGISDSQFQEIASGAKAGCPVSKVLKADITLSATLAA